MAGMTPKQVQILLRVKRELTLQRFLSDHFIPLLEERGYTLRNLLQALGGLAFDFKDTAVMHHLLDAVAEIDSTRSLCFAQHQQAAG